MRGKADRIAFLLEGRANLSALHIFQSSDQMESLDQMEIFRQEFMDPETF